MALGVDGVMIWNLGTDISDSGGSRWWYHSTLTDNYYLLITFNISLFSEMIM